MIIAIDGPAGAGKSTVARTVASQLGFAYIDTGAMYRAIALAVHEQGLQPRKDEAAIVALAETLPITLGLRGESVSIGERDVTQEIRTPHVSALTSVISTISGVRTAMVQQQRRLGESCNSDSGGAVLEGRDIQTVVFPDAEVKVFLTASSLSRSMRRMNQWNESGASTTIDDALQDVLVRDERDLGREVAPLRAAEDAVVIETDAMPAEQVAEKIVGLAQAARQKS